MDRISVGRRLFLVVLSIFIVNTLLFIVFQQQRERKYKIEMLNMKLQDYNSRMAENLRQAGGMNESSMSNYVKKHTVGGLRVTVICPDGRVLFDNETKDYARMLNHKNRTEVKEALRNGSGYDIGRSSSTTHSRYFYSATYFKDDSLIYRSALPYDSRLTKTLSPDHSYVWYSLVALLVLMFVLYRFIYRLGRNITKLRIFASRADHNENLETEDLAQFPGDELGETSEHIIKLYIRLQRTKEEQNVLKRQLTQNIAHELKTPVSSIQGYLETIINNPGISEEQKAQFLQRCYAQSQRLASLLSDISTLNRMDDAPSMMGFERVNISQIVSGIGKEVALQLAQRKMLFTDNLPDDIYINGNPSLIYSIFRNLMDNAIAYAGEGTQVVLNAVSDAGAWHFTFRDNGAGVGREHLERLFERFYRVDKGRSRKLGGTGLGLAIVKNAVLLHGGSITASLNPGGGLRFDFSLGKQ